MKVIIFVCISFVFIGSASNVVGIVRENLSEPAPATKYLFTASITFGTKHVCTGIIINTGWILTSAMCMANYNNSQSLDVYYGAHNRTNTQRTTNRIEKIVFHSKFEEKNLTNNLALLKLKDRIKFIPTVVQAVFLSANDIHENDTAFAIGWEKPNQSRDQDRPEMLKEYEIIVQPINKCKKPFDSNVNSDRVICTYTNVVNTLNVLDTGSALISKADSNLIGIASWHDGEAPRVYIKIGPYIPWIESIAFPFF